MTRSVCGMTTDIGTVLWRGPSLLDPAAEVAAILTYSHGNRKAPLPTVWIIATNMHPADLRDRGHDIAVCGTCPLRSLASGGGGGCYVRRRSNGVAGVWDALQRDRYLPWDAERVGRRLHRIGRPVRIGGDGDPAAVPLSVWEALEAVAPLGLLGYTHQWRDIDPDYSRFCMASVESPEGREHAHALGYRTFRVRAPEMPRETGETVCPASAEAGYKTTCDVCRACSGTGRGRRSDVVIIAHGASRARAARAVREWQGAPEYWEAP